MTGQFSDSPVTIVKMSLSLFNQKARKKAHFWANLGCVPQVRKSEGRGKKIFKDSQHMEADDLDIFDGEGEEVEEGGSLEEEDGETPIKAQDFHHILSIILEGYIKLQETGFMWDLLYKGKLLKVVPMVPDLTFEGMRAHKWS